MNDGSETRPVRILHLDDSPLDAELVRMTLDQEEKQLTASVQYVQNREEFVAALERKDFDIILSDYRMPDFDGDQALRLARETCPDIPFIMVTGELGEERVIETLQQGATDYVLKDRIFRLVPAIRRAIAGAETERKRKEAEEALRAAHQRTSDILQSIQDAFYTIDRGWHFTYINRQAEALWRVRGADAIGRNVHDVFPHAAGSIGMEELELAMRERKARHFEFFSPVIRTWIDVYAYPTAEGGLSVVFRDITERRKAEDALREREQILRSFYNTAPLLMGIAEPLFDEQDILHIYDNPAACKFFKTERVSGHKASEIGAPKEAIALWLKQYRLCEERGEPVTFEYLHTVEGKSRWLSSTVSFIGFTPRGHKHFSYVTVDLTERRRSEEAVRRQAALIDLTPDAIIVRTLQGKIVSWNRGAEDLYGWKREEVLGKDTNEVLHTQFPVSLGKILSELEAQGRWKGELIHGTRKGEKVTVESRWLLYNDPLEGPLLMESNVNITERKHVELEREYLLQEVERKRRLLRSVVDRAPVGIGILQGAEHRYIIVNPAFSPFVAGKGSVIGRTVAEVFPEVADQIVPLLDRVYRTGEPFQAMDMPFTLVRNNRREEAFFTFIYAPWHNEQEAVEGVMSIAVETTDQVRTRESIEQDRERLSLAQKAGRVGVFDWDVATSRVTWTREMEEMCDIEPGTFGGTYNAWAAYVHPEDLLHLKTMFDQWMQSPDQQDQKWEYRLVSARGRERWIAARGRLFRDPDGKPVRMIGTNLDITERKQVEEETRAAIEKAEAESVQLQAILNNLNDGVVVADAAGNVIYMNPAAMELHGYRDDHERDRLVSDLGSYFEVYDIAGNLIPHDRWTIPCVLGGEEVRDSIRRVHRTDIDKWFTASYNGTRVLDSSGNLRLIIITFRDVTAQIEAENEVRRLNTELEARVHERTQELEALNRELESFSYSVSHDLRSPLHIISGYAELLVQDTENLTAQQRERLRHIIANTGRMQALITALLDFARLAQKPLQETTVDMRALVHAVVREQRRSAGVAERDIVVDVHDLPHVKADPVLMRQVVTNLVSNAFKYTRKSERPQIEIGATAEDGSYRFFIRDNGVGFPREQAQKLFRVFQRLHAQSEFEGTGIGLANVRKIVERHGGKVWAEGEAGKGASFFFTLPRKERMPQKLRENKDS